MRLYTQSGSELPYAHVHACVSERMLLCWTALYLSRQQVGESLALLHLSVGFCLRDMQKMSVMQMLE